MTETVTPAKHTKPRGFAAMTKAQRSAIASKGGRAAHEQGVAHEWGTEEARAAGVKGGKISRGGRGRLKTATEIAAEQQGIGEERIAV